MPCVLWFGTPVVKAGGSMLQCTDALPNNVVHSPSYDTHTKGTQILPHLGKSAAGLAMVRSAIPVLTSMPLGQNKVWCTNHFVL